MKYTISFLINTLLLWGFLSISVFADDMDYEEYLLNTQSQLPVSAIHSVYRDKQGFLWYGTVNGLCRDDGYNLEIFRPDVLQQQDKIVGYMVEDDDQHLWLGADYGLFWLDKHDYTTHALCPEYWQGRRVNKILPLADHRFWIQSLHRVTLTDSIGYPIEEFYRLDSAQQRIRVEDSEIVGEHLYAVFQDHTLARLELQTRQWECFPSPIANQTIARITHDDTRSGLWILMESGAIFHCDLSNREPRYQRYHCDEEMEAHCYSLQLQPLDGTLWAMNNFGVRGYRIGEGHTLQCIYSTLGPKTHYHMLANLLCDSLFTFVSAFDRPSFMLRPQHKPFTHYPLEALGERVHYSPTIMALAQGNGGWWWTLQERTGVCLVNQQQRVVLWSDCLSNQRYDLRTGRILASSARGVWVNDDNHLRVSLITNDGPTIRMVQQLDIQTETQPTETVTQLCEDQEQRLWVGTSFGLYIYDAVTCSLIAKYSQIGHVSDLLPDAKGSMWVASLNGSLCEFHDPIQMTTHLDTVPLTSVHFNQDGELWVGTQHGHIFSYDTHTRVVTDHTEACGMNGDRINQLVCDKFGHLWIVTNQRVIEYNPHNQASRLFTTSDRNMPMQRFIPTAIATNDEGNILIGGIPGVICFQPSNLLDCVAQSAHVSITDIQVMKHSIVVDHRQHPDHPSITLAADDRDLEIFFSSLDHYNASQVRYAYRMLGVDTDWKYTLGGENSAFYNQLDKGDYTFEVKATDGNGLWCNQVTRLDIHRLPAFYESTLAYCCYALLLIGAAILIMVTTRRKTEQANDRLWNDSNELLQMRNYLRNQYTQGQPDDTVLPESEYRLLDKAFLAKVEKAIEDNLSKSDFGVEELAHAVNVSKSTLSRKLKAINSLSPLDFIRQKKMRQARLWLQDKDRNITEIAIALGYSDRKYFTTCFKKEFGQTPTDYRREKLGIKSEDK